MLNRKRKVSAFQNTKNYYYRFIIQKVTKDNVFEFDDEKWHAFMHAYILVHARVPGMHVCQKRAIFHDET